MSEDGYKTEILLTQYITHDVKRFVLTRPDQLDFIPGQAVEIAVAEKKWQKEKRPFTFTSLPDDGVLELVIKGYPDHDGVTKKLHSLKSGARLIMSEPFGAIRYKGPGVFIAGGAGVTPFISILRDVFSKNKEDKNILIFSNKTAEDVILEKELKILLRDRLDNIFTKSAPTNQTAQRIDKDMLKQYVVNSDQQFYVCGPPGFNKAMERYLKDFGLKPDSMVFEK